jgi:hypothetical protein
VENGGSNSKRIKLVPATLASLYFLHVPIKTRLAALDGYLATASIKLQHSKEISYC